MWNKCSAVWLTVKRQLRKLAVGVRGGQTRDLVIFEMGQLASKQ